MKKLLYLLSVVAVLGMFTACQEDELQLWGNEHHIYFEKFYKDAIAPGKERADSTLTSFFFYADEVNDLEAKLVVNMTGRLLEKDLLFKLKVVDETNQRDTITVKMHRSARLASMPNGVRLTVELVPMGDLKLGQTERTRAVIILTRDAVKPAWWDAEISNNLFGEYSSRKYKLFLLNIDPGATLNADMLRQAPYKAILLVRKFKQWLQEHPSQAVEEDGRPMTVNV